MVATGLAAMMVAGCTAPAPYLYNPALYDRDNADFAKTPKTMSALTVCYSKYGATQAQVAKLASETCARYGAGVTFTGNTYTLCPMVTPVGAQFACVGGASGNSVGRGGTSGIAGQPGAPETGFKEGARPMGVLFGRPQGVDTPGPLPDSPAVLPTPSETTQ